MNFLFHFFQQYYEIDTVLSPILQFRKTQALNSHSGAVDSNPSKHSLNSMLVTFVTMRGQWTKMINGYHSGSQIFPYFLCIVNENICFLMAYSDLVIRFVVTFSLCNSNSTAGKIAMAYTNHVIESYWVGSPGLVKCFCDVSLMT